MAKEELRIVATMCRKKPDYQPLAQSLLPVIRAFYENPENEKEFQEWLKKRKAEKGA